MTKTEIREVTARSLRLGYYDLGASAEYDGQHALAVSCAACHTRVKTCAGHRWKPVRKGRPWSQIVDGKPCTYERETTREALTRALADHLTDCPGETDDRN
jgi:hypothetical protein